MYKALEPSDYLHFDVDRCTGCTQCVKACPTRALRIRKQNNVIMVGQCIGCGECIRICEPRALSAKTADLKSLEQDPVSVAIVSPVLYSQFPGFMPEDVLNALRRIGFQYTMDLSGYAELFQYATEEFIIRNRKNPNAAFPLISPVCPVVIRLIAVRFRSLLPNVLPFLRPAALMAREIKPRIMAQTGLSEDEVVVYHITPNQSSLPHEHSFMNRVMGINDIYPELKRALKDKSRTESSIEAETRFEDERPATGIGVMWGVSGGEIANMDIDRAIAISGLRETILYLQRIELGLFKNLEYIEFRVCPEGCIGGMHTAIDKYLAKRTVQKLAEMIGLGRHRSGKDAILRLKKDWFLSETIQSWPDHDPEKDKPPMTVESLKKIDQILEECQGLNCAACGAPDCRTFAEDVCLGKSSRQDCIIHRAKRARKKIDRDD